MVKRVLVLDAIQLLQCEHESVCTESAMPLSLYSDVQLVC